MTHRYYFPRGSLPGQDARFYEPARFTPAYAVIPAACMTDIVTSYLPLWQRARAWILARPLSGFAETFAQYIVELEPGGGSPEPEPDPDAQAVLFVVQGSVTLGIGDDAIIVETGGYAYLAPGTKWAISNQSDKNATFHWIRKRYEPVDGIERPETFFATDADSVPEVMPGSAGKWSTTRFVDPADLRHDMHVNIVNFLPGGVIPFAETHVMEHGLYVLEGTARYLLNTDWVDVGPGDFVWLRAFCPQACEATGSGPFRYLLYKDVNRHPSLTIAAG